MSFLAAPLLFGLVLAGLPVLIHLLNRRRFQVIDWAPMKYLKLTLRTNRRRIQIEQILLLILRTLLIIILILAIARPVLSRVGLGGWLARRARTSRVIVIDTAMNTGYRVGGRSALDRAKEAAAEILANTGSQDAVTVLTTAPGSAPLAKEAGPEASGRLAGAVRDLHPTDAACNWAATFKQVDDALNTATFPDRQVILITDLRRSGWRTGGNAITQLADHWAAARVEARIVDVGSRDTADLALTKFAQDDALALPDGPVKLSAAVRNGTAATVTGASATLTVDGDRRPLLLPPLPAGATTDVPLTVTLDHAGTHALSLTLSDDALPGDDARWLCVDVRDRLDLTILDGRVGTGPFESAGDYVQVAATVGRAAWQVKRIGADDPAAAHPPGGDVTVLADVAALPPSAVSALAEQVRAGMGLIVFAGEQVDPTFYNDRLYPAGLLPCRVDRAVDGPVRGLVVEPLADSPAAPLAKLAPAALNRVQTRRLLAVDPPAKTDDTVRVLARWNDPEAHPALIERRLGRGRVLLVTTSADREWSDWPVDPTYVLLVRAATAALARPDAGDANAVAGHPIEYRPTADTAPINPRVTTPDDPAPQPVTLDHGTLKFTGANVAGMYALGWTDAAGGKQSRPIAVSYDVAAADLEPIDASALSRLLGNLSPAIVRFVPGQLAAGGAGRELWRTLAGTMLGLFLVETMFAAWVGRER
jgi:hypothetical protein